MVEFRIPTNLVANLLAERIKTEIKMREELNIISSGENLEDLSTTEIFNIIETAAFDLVALLPAHLLTQKNNLEEIIVKAIKSLPIAYERHEFSEYSESRISNLLKPIKSQFEVDDFEEAFVNN